MAVSVADNPVLHIERLGKRFGSLRAVDELSLEVRAGEFVVLLGPNGAGKTTLFQMLTGLFAPDHGTALIAGNDIRRHGTAALAALGVVFQQPTADRDRSVLANLRFHARLHGMPASRRETRIAEALDAVGLTDRARDRLGTLSGGNQRRVEVARALLHEPKLLLMDEASVGLDPASRADLLQRVLDQCRHRGLACLWATHLVDEASEADRVVVMDAGRIIADASPERLQDQARSTTLADAFIALTRDKPAMRMSA
ncbi:ATP-binding cassette domain-containing protein [Proteobacteria bacterium 005FR1]|nr:ATP-binding cassette domain-containing protein [Proteobacteria bacterium 005FR1]